MYLGMFCGIWHNKTHFWAKRLRRINPFCQELSVEYLFVFMTLWSKLSPNLSSTKVPSSRVVMLWKQEKCGYFYIFWPFLVYFCMFCGIWHINTHFWAKRLRRINPFCRELSVEYLFVFLTLLSKLSPNLSPQKFQVQGLLCFDLKQEKCVYFDIFWPFCCFLACFLVFDISKHFFE